jgi:hypothetical protein
MKASRLISGATFGPEALKVITQAFDDAWSEIAKNFAGDMLSTEAARLRLANAILANAREDSRDPEALKNAGLQAMALAPRFRDNNSN